MIRKAKPSDFANISKLWLDASLQAHNFIPVKYWQKMQNSVVRDYLPNSQTFVFVDKHQIKGFISIVDNNYIGALFVAPNYQNQKIGSKLLEYVRRHRGRFCLNVFAQNKRALYFYQKRDFKIIREQLDPSTKEKELTLAWALGCKSGFAKKHPGDS